MTSEEFESEKVSLIAKLLEKDKNLAQISYRMWSAISSGEYDFMKKEKIVKIIETLTQEDVVDFFKVSFGLIYFIFNQKYLK